MKYSFALIAALLVAACQMQETAAPQPPKEALVPGANGQIQVLVTDGGDGYLRPATPEDVERLSPPS